MTALTAETQEAIGRVALAADFDPVDWDAAPAWRRDVACKIAVAALAACGLSGADHVRSAWFLAMTTAGWQWGPFFDEETRQHPGIVLGELTSGGVRHWSNVVNLVRAEARRLGLWITE